MIRAFTILIIGTVPFIGRVSGGELLCNAACVVADPAGQVLFVSNGPVIRPFPDGVYVVSQR